MSLAEEIAKAKRLLDDGLLTEAEFQTIKGRLLSGGASSAPSSRDTPRQVRRRNITALILLLGAMLLIGLFWNEASIRSRDAAQRDAAIAERAAAKASEPEAKVVTPDAPAYVAPTPVPGGNWIVNRDSSAMDDSALIEASLLSENSVTFDGYRNERGWLFVRCKENETDVAVSVDTFISTQEQRVQFRLDDAKPQTSTWNVSTNYKALFARDAIAFARKLARSEQLVFRFTPHGDNAAEFTFDVRGLGDVLPEIAKACGWRP